MHPSGGCPVGRSVNRDRCPFRILMINFRPSKIWIRRVGHLPVPPLSLQIHFWILSSSIEFVAFTGSYLGKFNASIFYALTILSFQSALLKGSHHNKVDLKSLLLAKQRWHQEHPTWPNVSHSCFSHFNFGSC